MFEKELDHFEEKEGTQSLIGDAIDGQLVKVLKTPRNGEGDADLSINDKLIIRQKYQQFQESAKTHILFEVLRDCGDFTIGWNDFQTELNRANCG